jgi:predicted nuclease of predicted toxin-antitoxin system
MKILVDENIPLLTVKQLRKMGHDVCDIRGTSEKGMSDELLWKKTCEEKRLLITTDKGFASSREKGHYGILIIALRKPNRHKISKRVVEAMKRFSASKWRGLLVVMRDEVMSAWRPSKHK